MKPEAPRIDSVGHSAVVLMWTPVSMKDISGYKVRKNNGESFYLLDYYFYMETVFIKPLPIGQTTFK